jgi:plastocyanin
MIYALALGAVIAATAILQPVRGLGAVTPVQVGDDFFSPASVTINQNDTVTWTWVGQIDHSSSSASGIWDSGIVGHGSVFSHAFATTGSFPYVCHVHSFQTGSVKVNAAAAPPPTVDITSPTNNAVFFAPARFELAASASSSGGAISKVEFFEGATSLGAITASPYQLAVTNLGAGSYAFSAVATDNQGRAATNRAAITVDPATPLRITNPRWLSPTSFGFSYSTDPGVGYAVDRTPDFTIWTAMETNTATGPASSFTDTSAGPGQGFYRVRRLEFP